MPKKERINITIDKQLVNYIDSHFKIPGTNWSRSKFIEGCIKNRVEEVIKPEDHLRNEIKFHEEKRKFHDDFLAELYIKEKRIKGQLKLIPTKTLSELRKNSERLISIDTEQEVGEIMDPVQLNPENMSQSEIEMREKALKIIHS